MMQARSYRNNCFILEEDKNIVSTLLGKKTGEMILENQLNFVKLLVKPACKI